MRRCGGVALVHGEVSLWLGCWCLLRSVEVVARNSCGLGVRLGVEGLWLSDLLQFAVLRKDFELHDDEDAVYNQ
jgi:hypothetical protein